MKSRLFTEKAGIILALIGGGIFLTYLLLALIQGNWEFSSDHPISEEKFGQFGDFVGGVVGTAFSLASVILFYVALKDQRKDFATGQETLQVQLEAFKKQVEEFELQRKELIETRKIYSEQSRTMQLQQFDSNFYSLLNVFIEQRNTMSDQGYQPYFDQLSSEMIKVRPDQIRDQPYHIAFENICNQYVKVYDNADAQLPLYFMTLYRLFKIIEESNDLKEDEKRKYHKILRALITHRELMILYYNYHSPYGKKAVPIALKYDYFKHLKLSHKVEYVLKFEFRTQQLRLSSLLYIESIKDLLQRNISKAKELEIEGNVIEEIELEEDLFIGIYLYTTLEIRLIFKNNKQVALDRDRTQLADWLLCILIDHLYHCNFKKFNPGDIHRSTVEQEQLNLFYFRYEFQNIT